MFLSVLFMTISFASVLPQQHSFWTRVAINSTETVKSDIVLGGELAWRYDYIERALSKQKRGQYFQDGFREEYAMTAGEKKVLSEKWDDLRIVAVSILSRWKRLRTQMYWRRIRSSVLHYKFTVRDGESGRILDRVIRKF